MKRIRRIAAYLVVVSIALLVVGLGPRFLNMGSEYTTAQVMRATLDFVKNTDGQWPRSWSDLKLDDLSARTRMRFDLDPATATEQEVMSAIATRSGRYYTYPHAEENLRAIWQELLRHRHEPTEQGPDSTRRRTAPGSPSSP